MKISCGTVFKAELRQIRCYIRKCSVLLLMNQVSEVGVDCRCLRTGCFGES
jgi:hypothetical protein